MTIPVSSNDTTEGTVSVSSLTFTPANWNVPQTITVSSVEDTATDGNVAFTIVLGVATSGDPVYGGLNPADATVTTLDNDFNKFFVVDDATTNTTYRYGSTVNSRSNNALNSGNSAPRGAAMTAAGDKVWVIDANKKVYVYNSSTGALLGSWNANGLANNATVEGITVWGNDVWIVDARLDRVYYYANAAGRTSGSQSATSYFALHANNISPKDLVTDGTQFWVVDDQTLDRVYQYKMDGTYNGRWSIDPANANPTGITLDPSNPRHLWIVNNAATGTDRVYQYDNAVSANYGSGSKLASTSYALAAGNSNPQGIADPPPVSDGDGGRVEHNATVAARGILLVGLPGSPTLADTSAVNADEEPSPSRPIDDDPQVRSEWDPSLVSPTSNARLSSAALVAVDWLDWDAFDFAPIDVSGQQVLKNASF